MCMCARVCTTTDANGAYEFFVPWRRICGASFRQYSRLPRFLLRHSCMTTLDHMIFTLPNFRESARLHMLMRVIQRKNLQLRCVASLSVPSWRLQNPSQPQNAEERQLHGTTTGRGSYAGTLLNMHSRPVICSNCSRDSLYSCGPHCWL